MNPMNPMNPMNLMSPTDKDLDETQYNFVRILDEFVAGVADEMERSMKNACYGDKSCTYVKGAAKPEIETQDPNDHKKKILEDIKNGVKILVENIENGYFGKYDEVKQLEQFKKAFELLNSKDIDISKLDIINYFNDNRCRYRHVDGTNESRYTVVYNNIELFTITKIDSETRFPEKRISLLEKQTSGLSFDLEFHAGFNEIYKGIKTENNYEQVSAKDKIEADITPWIEIFTNKITGYINRFDNNHNRCAETREEINRILELLSSDVVDLNKVQTIDFFGDSFAGKSGYSVAYNGNILFTINNIEKGEFRKQRYTITKDLEIDFTDAFYKLYHSLKVYSDEKTEEKKGIEAYLQEGIETVKANMEADIENKSKCDDTLIAIKKILQLLNSSVISVIDLERICFLGIYDLDYDDPFYSDEIDSGYTVTHKGVELFRIEDSQDNYRNKSFSVDLFDGFNELYYAPEAPWIL